MIFDQLLSVQLHITCILCFTVTADSVAITFSFAHYVFSRNENIHSSFPSLWLYILGSSPDFSDSSSIVVIIIFPVIVVVVTSVPWWFCYEKQF